MVKNLPANAGEETWIRSLCWEDRLEEERATHSSLLAWKIPLTEQTWQVTVRGLSVLNGY